ncbi:MAG TPA: hypothetical protein PLD20_16900 [Blastocatellia bacterium]|nr:hypothetical protein [Blastocatellia bacterium]HMV86040.1 hypothetical protein [Blastocatellia bacterium]HMX28073.1 hypothetical protein [Blastocatellia bacterium]HMY70257.1 hypothetical protein [Blastocatellia bacterium]HMZ19617.1 hypothetical protein [Blastocatellia bacterium]
MRRINKQALVLTFFALISLLLLDGSRSFSAQTVKSDLAADPALQTTPGQWTQTNGPYGGSIRSLLANGSNLFVGSANGVFLSTDNGQTWKAANKGMTGVTVTCLVVSENNLFAGTFDRGVFRSNDNGQNWVPVNSGLTGLFIRALAVSGKNLFAGTTKVFLSTDNGQSWTAVLDKGINSMTVNGDYIFAGTVSQGVFLSTDNGRNWTAVNNGLTSLDSSLNIISLVASGNNLIAGVVYGDLFLSTNSGQSWVSVHNRVSIMSPGFNCLAASGSNVIAGAEGGILFSADNGRTWAMVSNLSALCLAISGNNLFAGGFRELLASTNNGRDWTEINQGIISTSVSSLLINGNNLFAGTSSNGVFRSGDNGQTWTAVNNSLPSASIGLLAASGENLFAVASLWGVFRSTDNGQNWVAINNGLANSVTGIAPTVRALAVSGNTLVAGTLNGVFLSTNNGQSWVPSNNGLSTSSVFSMAVSGKNLFAGTGGGGVFLSIDDGRNWAAVNQGLTNLFIQSLVVSGNNLFAGTIGGGVFLSANGGQHWAAVNKGLTSLNVRTLAVNGETILSGTSTGVFLSTDAGQNWFSINRGLPGTNIFCLVSSGSTFFAGTDASGVFRGSDFVRSAATVSAASYDGKTVAADSIVAAFGSGFSTESRLAESQPLPTSLAGASIRLRDSAGIERLAPLFFVSPNQINFQIPLGTAAGAATATITTTDAGVAFSPLQISSVAPGLFTANANGQGVPAAVVLRIKPDGQQLFEAVSRFDQAQNKFVAVPIDVGPTGDRLFLVLYGTGIRHRSSLSAVTVNFGGLDAQVIYAGLQPDFIGLDQINVRVPRELAGRGDVFITLKADGVAANAVQVNIK